MTTTCAACSAESVQQVLHLGSQPPSNIYLQRTDEFFPVHDLRLGVCSACSMLQLIDPMPPALARCKHPWLTYTEPEEHLDAVAGNTAQLFDGHCHSKVVRGMSYKDDTLLHRLMQYGMRAAEDVRHDVYEGLERIQGRITAAWAHEQRELYGAVDVLLVRHILEHAHKPQEFVQACMHLLDEQGLMVIEIPGCDAMLRHHEHMRLWEEHTLYFTASSLCIFLERCGLSIVNCSEYGSPWEPSVVVTAALARNRGSQVPYLDGASNDVALATAFGESIDARARNIQHVLGRIHDSGRHIVLFGAGHLGIKYVNFYGLAPLIHAFIDDFPQKTGTYLPKSCLPVISSEWLEHTKNGVCLLGCRPESHGHIMNKYANFQQHGGQWFSIFAGSPLTLGEAGNG